MAKALVQTPTLLIRYLIKWKIHINVLIVGKASVEVHASLDTGESILERNLISVLIVGKVSVTAQILSLTGESTQERNLISVVSVENVLIKAPVL